MPDLEAFSFAYSIFDIAWNIYCDLIDLLPFFGIVTSVLIGVRLSLVNISRVTGWGGVSD